MADTRNPTPSSGSLAYPMLAFALNALYACRQGYDLLYYRLREPTCTPAPGMAPRAASYCKLVAVAHAFAMDKHDMVVYLDSDSFFNVRTNVSLPALLRSYAPPPGRLPTNPWRRTLSERALSDAVWFANDRPKLGDRPNAGFHAWQRQHGSWAAAMRVLRTWWSLPAYRYGAEHDFEQHALQWVVAHLGLGLRRRGGATEPLLGVLQLHAMAAEFSGNAIAHVDHAKPEGSRMYAVVALGFMDALCGCVPLACIASTHEVGIARANTLTRARARQVRDGNGAGDSRPRAGHRHSAARRPEAHLRASGAADTGSREVVKRACGGEYAGSGSAGRRAAARSGAWLATSSTASRRLGAVCGVAGVGFAARMAPHAGLQRDFGGDASASAAREADASGGATAGAATAVSVEPVAT